MLAFHTAVKQAFHIAVKHWIHEKHPSGMDFTDDIATLSDTTHGLGVNHLCSHFQQQPSKSPMSVAGKASNHLGKIGMGRHLENKTALTQMFSQPFKIDVKHGKERIHQT